MKRKSLSTVVFEGLLDQIRSGRLGPGAQLPTEADLCDSFAVSRTVVREAVARLRSEGLVIPRQGKGVFVSEAPLGSFSIPDQDLDALPQTLALLELRLGVEVESAGLCALRCTRDEAQAIRAEMAAAGRLLADRHGFDYPYELEEVVLRTWSEHKGAITKR